MKMEVKDIANIPIIIVFIAVGIKKIIGGSFTRGRRRGNIEDGRSTGL